MRKLTDVQRAYLAGFIDGEGCITISKYQGKNSRTPSYSLVLIVSQNNSRMLQDLVEMTGVGTVVRDTDRGHSWRIASRGAVELLEQTIDLLRLKREEGEVALQFAEFMSQQKPGGKGKIITPFVVAKKEQFYLRLRQLKGTSSTGRGRPR